MLILTQKIKKITINIAEKKFSSDYIPEEYIYIAVWDAKGKMVFQKKLSDAEIKEEKIELPFEVGYQLEMYHPIPSRLVSSPDLYSIIDSNSPFTLLVMTPLGVTNPKMESYPTDIIEADFIHPTPFQWGSMRMLLNLHLQRNPQRLPLSLLISLLPAPIPSSAPVPARVSIRQQN